MTSYFLNSDSDLIKSTSGPGGYFKYEMFEGFTVGTRKPICIWSPLRLQEVLSMKEWRRIETNQAEAILARWENHGLVWPSGDQHKSPRRG